MKRIQLKQWIRVHCLIMKMFFYWILVLQFLPKIQKGFLHDRDLHHERVKYLRPFSPCICKENIVCSKSLNEFAQVAKIGKIKSFWKCNNFSKKNYSKTTSNGTFEAKMNYNPCPCLLSLVKKLNCEMKRSTSSLSAILGNTKTGILNPSAQCQNIHDKIYI